jgi:hypothetical protein
MIATSHISESFRQILSRAEIPIVGLVDDLLAACRSVGVRMDYRSDRCCVRFFGNGAHEEVEVSFTKGVFRGILARVAVLCNQRVADSVSPYGGRAKLISGSDRPALLSVSFANTASEQWLELVPENEMSSAAP